MSVISEIFTESQMVSVPALAKLRSHADFAASGCNLEKFVEMLTNWLIRLSILRPSRNIIRDDDKSPRVSSFGSTSLSVFRAHGVMKLVRYS